MEPFPPQIENIFEIRHHALIHGMFAQVIAHELPANSASIVRDVIRAYALQRGHRMALRGQKLNLPLTMENYLLLGEWIPEPEKTRQEDIQTTPEYHSRVLECPWNAYWAENGYSELGKLYCEVIDATLVEGFSPQLSLDILGTLSGGDPYCEFHWKGLNRTPTVEERMAHKRQWLGNYAKKSWEYHTAHLYWAYRHEVSALKLEQADAIFAAVNAAITQKFGEPILNRLMRYQNVNFSQLHYPQPKVFIMGFGNLMESLFPAFDWGNTSGNRGTYFRVTTADAPAIAEKREQFKIPVVFKDNLAQLTDFQPEIILFAPPPEKVEELVSTALKPYYHALRAAHARVPALYAFPFRPAVDYYINELGADVPIATILPNDIRTIASTPVGNCGHHFCSFSPNWSMYDFEMLKTIMGQYGQILALPEDAKMKLLMARVMTTAFLAVGPQFASIAAQLGLSLKTSEIFQLTTAKFNAGDQPHGSPLENGGQKFFSDGAWQSHPALKWLYNDVIMGWQGGIEAYLAQVGISLQAYPRVVAEMVELALKQLSSEPIAALQAHIQTAATKGGLLERALALCAAELPALSGGQQEIAEFYQNLPRAKVVELVKSITVKVYKYAQNI